MTKLSMSEEEMLKRKYTRPYEKRIEELKKENKTLEGCLLAEQEYTQMLEKQIERMKCCGNCKYSNQESAYSIVCKVGGVDKSDYINIDDNQVCDKWELED